MRARHILSAVVGVVVAAVAHPAAAQDVARIVDAQMPDARPVATFDVAMGHHRGAPARLTVADSAGQLVGTMWLVGDGVARPLSVTVDGADLVLRGDTPRGAVEFVLYRQNARSRQRSIFGRWTIGAAQGDLRGSLKG